MIASVIESINRALHQALTQDERVIILGEDLLDPYGGAFKATRGLSTAFPERVWSTPISEAGVVGLATGMALRGLHPVVEIMFGDFLTLAADQIINHAAKFRQMYNHQVSVPLVIRTPMGGRRGYGPTHSQTLEKHFLGVPGLRVLAATHFGDPGELLYQAILTSEDPTLFIENKLLYLLPVGDDKLLADFDVQSTDRHDATVNTNVTLHTPAYRLVIRDAPPASMTIAAYGYMAELARQAIVQLAYEHEIFAELVTPTQLSPFRLEALLESARRTGRLLTVEEGGGSLGWGAEVLAQAVEYLGPRLKAACRLAAADTPIPSSGPLEAAALPRVADIVNAALILEYNP